MIDDLAQWIARNPWLPWFVLGLSGVATLSGLVAIPWAIVRIPADYFVSRRRPRKQFLGLHPAARVVAIGLKNLLGVVLLLGGVVMLITPGPGFIALLLGLSLVNLPGKWAIERAIVRNRAVLRAMNRVRRRRGQPPLIPPAARGSGAPPSIVK